MWLGPLTGPRRLRMDLFAPPPLSTRAAAALVGREPGPAPSITVASVSPLSLLRKDSVLFQVRAWPCGQQVVGLCWLVVSQHCCVNVLCECVVMEWSRSVRLVVALAEEAKVQRSWQCTHTHAMNPPSLLPA